MLGHKRTIIACATGELALEENIVECCCEQASVWRSTVNPPFFVVGMPRAGTTLLARMLDQHSAHCVFPEALLFRLLYYFGCEKQFTHPWQYHLFMNVLYAGFVRYNDPAAWCVASVAAQQPHYNGSTRLLLNKLAARYCHEKNAQAWGEKTPVHALHLPEMYALYPNAKLLCLVRDPRDVLVSHAVRWNKGQFDSRFAFAKAASLKNYFHALKHVNPFPDTSTLWVRYEDLTRDPETQLARVCELLEVPFEQAMLEFHRQHIMPADLRPHHALLEQPLTSSRQGRYKDAFSPSQQAALDAFFAEELEAFGYERSAHKSIGVLERLAQTYGHVGYVARKSRVSLARVRLQGRLHLTAYQLFDTNMARWQGYRLAHSEAQWRARMNSNEGKRTLVPHPPAANVATT